MNRTKLFAFLFICAGALIILSQAAFIVHQPVQAVVFQFGDPRRVIKEPGLHFKTPFVQDVVYFDKRILDLDPEPSEIPLSDQKRIIVDAYARYRIADPLLFYQSIFNENNFRDQFGKSLNSAVRDVMGKIVIPDLLSDKRKEIMDQINAIVAQAAKSYGVELVDVRIGRTDLPKEISQNVYDRMRTEREQEANLLRAEGDEIKQRIIAEADKEKTVILAEARRQSQILLGEGDGERNVILGKAYGKDPEFFNFYRSMEAYKEAFGNGSTTGTSMVLSPDSDFFKYFGAEAPKK